MTPSFITLAPLDPEALRLEIEDATFGGVVVFCGQVRRLTGTQVTDFLDYECYEEMAQAQYDQIKSDIETKFDCRCIAQHRIGRLAPGDTAVVTIAAAPHRKEAFAACSELIDRIKADVPIWKAELP